MCLPQTIEVLNHLWLNLERYVSTEWELWILSHISDTAIDIFTGSEDQRKRDQKFDWVPYLFLTPQKGDVSVDKELLAHRQWCIIAPYCHHLNATAFTFLPVNQLISGHRIPIGIKWHIITIFGKIYFLQLSKNLWGWSKVRDRKWKIWNKMNIIFYHIIVTKWALGYSHYYFDWHVWILSRWICHN